MTVTARTIVSHLKALGSPEIAAHSQRFFKTGKGEYGEGDRFLGIRVPVIRKAVRQFGTVPLTVVDTLLQSQYHEVRLFALLLMVQRFTRNPEEQETIVQLYLQRTRFINNWDLVDTSAAGILGVHCYTRDRSVLYSLLGSDALWERRIAIMATFHFIRQGDFADTLEMVGRVLDDEEDLIHKAAGWMLREIGNRDVAVEKAFLQQHCRRMPRTMLRYAIEKFSRDVRQKYLADCR